MKKAVSVLFILMVGGVLSQINAQVWSLPSAPPPPVNNWQTKIWTNLRMGQIGNQIAADMARGTTIGKKRTGGTRKTAAVPRPAKSDSPVFQKQFAFRRSANSPLAQKIVEAQKGNSGDAKKMQQLIDGIWQEYEKSFADENSRLGMPFNDVVAAMTYFIVGSYLYANDIPSLDSENSVAVYKQIAGIMAKDTEFAKLQSSDKQLFAELLVTMGGMPAFVYSQNHSKDELKSLAQANLERIFGDKAGNLQITADGIAF